MSDMQTAAGNAGSKENKAFMILSALGILFVVDEHLGRPIAFLSQIFPYDSFFMPMFVFISGYCACAICGLSIAAIADECRINLLYIVVRAVWSSVGSF